jgi:membrane protease YdiL (CAAX protease family)
MGLSATTLLILFITALFKTTLAEEILFRGLIGKQLINKFGFKAGNILQALFFGFIHLLLFWVLTKTTIAPLFIIFIFSSLAGWIIGYIKEQHANGSIIPGWVAHGLGNIVSYYILAFVM